MTTPVFQAPQTNPFGLSDVGTSASPTFADIDGDGDLDALVGNRGGNTLFFSNTGTTSSAAFAAAATNPFGLSDVGTYASPSFADIDGDGDLDAFVGKGIGDTLFFSNTGTTSSAAFAAAVTNPFGLKDVGDYAAPSFADIDADGDQDAFVGNKSGNTLFFRNTGTAGSVAFAAAVTNPFGLGDAGMYAAPSFADIDGDGDLDALIGESAGSMWFFQNTGTAGSAAFAAASFNPFALSDVGISASPTFADIDGDGDPDAFVGNRDGNSLLFLNTPPGIRIAHSGGNAAVTENGASDSYTVVLIRQPTSDVTITLNTTNGQVTTDVASLTFTSANWNTPQTVTVTARNDTVGEGAHRGVIGYSFASTDIYYNNLAVASTQVAVTDNDLPTATPIFNSPQTNPFGLSGVGFFASPALADIDADGDLDAFVGESAGNTLFFQNTGAAGSAAFATASTNPFGLSDAGNSASPVFADIDGDGDLDAFVGERYGNTWFFQNTGTAGSAAFTGAVANPAGLSDVGRYANPTFADTDNDGDLDAFIGEYNGQHAVFPEYRHSG